MRDKKRLFIYPNTSEFYRIGGNNYIRDLIFHLGHSFKIVNSRTKIGLLDMLFKLHKSDAIYFNWIEDVPDRRFGFLQVPLLVLILILAKVFNIKIIWFIHNNVSHSNKHVILKKFIVWLMRQTSDVVLSHSNELQLKIDQKKFYCFDHPIEVYQPINQKQSFKYDLLIWGTVSPYKGIDQFIKAVTSDENFKRFSILIAGRFKSDSYYGDLKKLKLVNVDIENKILTEQELAELFTKSHYVLFTYNSPSVLSSAALCKTLSFGKEVIGPNIGSFKELGRKKLLYSYESFTDLGNLLSELRSGRIAPIDKDLLAQYIESVSWNNFASFLADTINDL